MTWIFVDKEKGGGEGEMRQQMRRNMRRGGNYRRYDTDAMRGDYHEGYRQGYKHGWEDREDDLHKITRGGLRARLPLIT